MVFYDHWLWSACVQRRLVAGRAGRSAALPAAKAFQQNERKLKVPPPRTVVFQSQNCKILQITNSLPSRYECFVCGVDRTTLDDFAISKEDHETYEHNKWNYLMYLHHITNKASDVAPLTGVAAYVAACTAIGEHDWLPLNTSFKLEQLVKDNEKRTNINHDLRPIYDALLATQDMVKKFKVPLPYLKTQSEVKQRKTKISHRSRGSRMILPPSSSLPSRANLHVPRPARPAAASVE